MWGHCINSLFKNFLNDTHSSMGVLYVHIEKQMLTRNYTRKFFEDSNTEILNIHNMKLNENNTFKDYFEEIALNSCDNFELLYKKDKLL